MNINTVKLLIIFITAVLVTACGDTSKGSNSEIDSHLKRSKAYEEQGQYKAAMIEARNIIKKSPQDLTGYIRLANLFLALNNAQAVINLLEPVTQNHTNTEAELLLAEAFSKLGKYFSAAKSLDAYKTAGGNTSDNRYKILVIKNLAGNGNTSEVQQQLLSLVKSNPDDLEIRSLLITMYLAENNLTEAEKLIAENLAKAPKDPQTLVLSAKIAYINNNLDLAEKQLTNALIELPETDIIKPMRAMVLTDLSKVLTEQGRTTEAMVYSKLLASENPQAQDAKTRLNRALEAINNNQLEQAEKELNELNELYPHFNLSAIYLGLLNYQKGAYEDAAELLSQHVDPEIASAELVKTTAMAQLQQQQTSEAIQLLEQAIKRHPDNEQLLALFGLTAINTPGLNEKAKAALEKAITINPNNAKARHALARYYLQNKKVELGLSQLQQALTLNPSDVIATTLYAQALTQQGRAKEARAAISKLTKNAPNDPNAFILEARQALADKDIASAAKLFQRAAELDENNFLAHSSLAKLALVQKDPAAARQHFLKLIQINPDNPEGYKGLISSYEIQQQAAIGVEELQQLQKKYQQQTPVPAYVLAEYFARNQQIEKAITFYQLGRKSDSKHSVDATLGAALYYQHGKQLLHQKQFSNAIDALSTAAQYNPESIEIVEFLAEAEINANKPDDARKTITQLATNFPDNEMLAELLTAKLEIQQGNTEQGFSTLDKIWENHPSDQLASKLYNIYLTENQKDKVGALLEKWQRSTPESQSAKTLLATHYQNFGQPQKAITLFKDLVNQNPSNVIALNNLAWLYQTQNDSRSLATAEQAYKLAPENYAVLDTYGWILMQRGEAAKAVGILEAAARKAPENQEIQSHLKQAREKLKQ